MTLNLPKHLRFLHESLPGSAYGATGNNSQAFLIAGDIARECDQLNSESEAANVCSHLFHANDGLICFLKKCVPHNQFVEVRLKLVCFLLEFVEIYSQIVVTYAVDIKDVCLLIYSHDTTAKIRINVLRLIIKLLIFSSGKQTGIDLNPLQLMERFYFELSKKTGVSPTVLQVVLELLGILVEYFPELVSQYSDRLLKVYNSRLRQQMKSTVKSPDFPIICGCFSGLASLLNAISHRLTEEDRQTIYDYISLAVKFDKDVKRYEYIRAVLLLISKHASTFRNQIYIDWLKMFENLKEWSHFYKNRNVKIFATIAMESYFKQMAIVLCQKLDSPEERSNAEKIFKIFAGTFCEILRSNESASIVMAVQGYGYFAAPCKRLMNDKEVKIMFTEVVQRCEDLFFSEHGVVEDRVDYLPSFVSALANILMQLDEMSEIFLASLENLVVCLIDNYPKIPMKTQFLSYNAIIKLCISLYPKGVVFKPFIQKIVYQGILRTCWHSIPLDLTTGANVTNDESDSDAISYRNYVDFWKNMLQIVKLKELNEMGVSIADRQMVTYAIYDGIISSVLQIIAKLDFSLQKNDPSETSLQSDVSSDPITGLQASKPKDFQIFVNLVEFCKALLLDGHLPLFKKWIYIFGHSMISLSTKYPLVSGLYKLLAVNLKICSRLNYFAKLKSSDIKSIASSNAVNSDVRLKSFVLFSKCAKEISTRLQQYKDDLLTSCVQVILSLPVEIVTEILHYIIPVACQAITLGYSYLPLVEDMLTALEFWSLRIFPEILKPLYQAIIPLLSGYLTSVNESSETQPLLIGKKTLASVTKLTKQKSVSSDLTSSVWQVKIRIVKLLGSLGGNINSMLVDDRLESIGKVALSWDSNKLMKFPVPFLDMKPEIYLDPFLPKVVDLACLSSDRQTKVASSELLHALILYLLGSRSSLQPKLQLEKPMTKLLKKLFPAILKLSCDADMVVNQLFNPLLFQLIHWFSSQRQEILNDQITLLDSLMDGVTSATDISLRDMCAKGIKELLQWTIKHSSISRLKKNPYGTKFILKRMYSLCFHPKPSLRLGAALLFNSIYSVLREEETLVDRFIIEILYYFVESLAMADKDEKHLGTREQCSIALNHVEKIILTKAVTLKKKNLTRRKPVEFKTYAAAGSDWDQMILWLLHQFGRSECDCRHRCMEFVKKFCGTADGGLETCFKNILRKSGANYFVSIFEGDRKTSASERLQLVKCPLMIDYLRKSFTVTSAITWMKLFLGLLDCYTWVIGNNLLKPVDIFAYDTQSVLLEGIRKFNSEVSLVDIFAIVNRCKLSVEVDAVFTPSEINEYNRLKCTLIVRIMDFVEMVASHTLVNAGSVLDSVVDEWFWKMIISCIFHPLEIGFDMDDTEVSYELPLKVKGLLMALIKNLPKTFIEKLKSELSNEISVTQTWITVKNLSNCDSNCSSEHLDKLQWIISGFKLLNELNLLHSTIQLFDDLSSEYGQLFANMAFAMCIYSKNDVVYGKALEKFELNVAQELLRLSFSFGLSTKVLIDILVDQTAIMHVSGHSELSKGKHFLSTFHFDVTCFIMENANVSIPYLMSNVAKQELEYAHIVISVFDCLTANPNLRKNGQVVEKILLYWGELHSWWHPRTSEELKRILVHILTQTLLMDYKTSSNRNCLQYLPTLDTFVLLLIDPNLKLKFKARILDLLPIYADLPSDHLFELKKILVKMAVMHFPLKCSDLLVNSPQLKDYVATFTKILFALELSRSIMLLELVIELVCVESQHVCDEFVQQTLANLMKKSNFDKQSLIVDAVFNIFKSETVEQEDFRPAVVEKFLVPLLCKANRVVFIKFYVKNVKAMTSYVIEKSLKTIDSNYPQQLISKLCCLKLIATLYNRCSGDELNTLESKVNDAFCDDAAKTGKELTQEITRAAHNIRKENMQGETAFLELRRRIHCAAYNCLIAVISCTQTDVKFFTGLLFTENPAKGDVLWENLIDVNKKYSFDVELNSPLERRKTLANIRHMLKQENSSSDGSVEVGDDDIKSFPLSVADSAVMNLAESSLADDVSQFDLPSSSHIRNYFSNKKRRNLGETTNQAEKHYSDGFIELEMDLLNQHECMISMNGLLRHLHDYVTPVPSNVTDLPMPTWMKAVHKKFCDEQTPDNVKLFFGKLIINNDKVFQPYANMWLYPLMQLIVENKSGKGINYFVVDLIVVLLSWSSTSLPANTMMERSMATRLLEFLIKNAHHERREILRNNLEIIKTLVECWKTRLDIPTQIIYDNIKSSKLDSNENLIGIQMMGIVLSCDLPPYTSTVGLDEERFLNTLALNLNSKRKEIYSSAAEVIGLILKYFANRQTNLEDFPFYLFVCKQLSKLEMNMDQFIVCVHHVEKSFPSIVDSFSHKIIFYLPKTRGNYRQLSLKTLLSRIECIAGLYLELKSIGLYEFMAHDDENVQHICLMIVYKVLANLSPEQVLQVFDHITSFAENTSVNCRRVMYEILIKIFNEFSEINEEILNRSKRALLKGLGDLDMGLRLMILNFWGHEQRLSTATVARILSVLGNLYLPECESHFLSVSTYLMLELTSKSPDYTRLIFEHPLSDCKFENFNISADWRVRHASMLPLFVETVASESLSTVSMSDFESQTPQLRATQEVLAFTPTQDEQRSFDWLTQSSVDSSATDSSVFDDIAISKFLFKPKRPQAVKEIPFSSGSSKDGQDKAVLNILKRRFLKNVDTQKKFHIQRNTKLQQRRQTLLQEQKLAREAKVSLFRQYRKGDLPDIQITYSSVIAPLQALAQRDDEIAKLLFTSLAIGILEEAVVDSNSKSLTIKTLEDNLNNILKETTLYTPNVIQAIQEIGLNFCDKIHLDIAALVLASEQSFQQNTGILLLEKMIFQYSTQEEFANRDENKDLWMKLARLNKSQGNYDVVNGIVSYHFGLPQEARDAFQAEDSGDYSLALKLIRKFSKDVQLNTKEEDDISEYNLWDESTLLCYDRLCQWEKLNKWAVQCFDDSSSPDLNLIWKNSNAERYLGYLMRSNVKLTMEGSNNQSFIDFLDSSINDSDHPEKKSYLENHFSSELALLSVVQKDYNRAWHYTTLGVKNFIHYWNAISVLSSGHRKSHLEKLQSLVEMDNFLQIIKASVSDFSNAVSSLIKLWHNSLPNVATNANIIYDITANRNLYLKRLEGEASSKSCDESQTEGQSPEDLFSLFHQSRFAFSMNCVEAASLQKNFSLALLLLKETMNLYKKSDDDGLQKKWLLAYCKTHQRQSSVQENDMKVKSLLNVWTNLDKHVSDDETSLSVLREVKLIHSRNSDLLVKYLKEDSFLLESVLASQIYKRINCRSNSSMNEVIDGLVSYSYRCLKDAISFSADDSDRNVVDVAVTHLHFAKFCDKFFKEYDPASGSKSVKFDLSCDNLACEVVENHLKAIKYGSEEGIQLFPRLLQILESYPVTFNIFTRITKEIPVWMFLRWNSQLVALLDKPCASALFQLVYSIAETYPMALVYNFNVSKQGFKFAATKEGQKNKTAVTRIQNIFDGLWLVNKFILALEQLDHPCSRFKEFQDSCAKLDSKAEIIKGFREFYDKQIIKPMSNATTALPYGKITKLAAKEMKKILETSFGKDICKIDGMAIQSIQNEFVAIWTQFRKIETFGTKLLKDYSEWLSDFSGSKFSTELEIPGQYTGLRKPLPEYHTRVSKFFETIDVLKSIRKPKAVTVVGNDCKEYKYLVKSGEDLRLDQRIQQLFQIMNGIYSRDGACSSRQLKLTTYQVIPLTIRLGWLEWLPNTVTLKEFMEIGMNDDDLKLQNRCEGSVQGFLRKFSSSDNDILIYKDFYLKCDRSAAIKKYKEIVNGSPVDALKKSFWLISASPEAFITLRNLFIISHGVLSISQYILGIGDRHLSNFLVSLNTGEIMGIDFGHSFGSSTSFLPIPELMPFRLTPQLLNLMNPMQEHGLLHRTMVHILNALRNNPEILINTMDVFVKEPSLDWETFARRQWTSESSTVKDGNYRLAHLDSSWYSKQRIGFAIQKLDGRNSAYVMMDELNCGVKRQDPVMKKYKEVCLGSADINIRAKLGDHNLSVEKQVLCLLDHAMDQHILAKTFRGWQSWM